MNSYKVILDNYYVSRGGTVIRNSDGYEVKATKKKNSGLYSICVSMDNKKYNALVHKLVALKYVPNTNSDLYKNIEFIDGDKENIKDTNLRWIKKKSNKKQKVMQIDKETLKVINIFDSILAASIETGISVESISMCINKKKNTAGKFLWEKL